MLDYKKLDYQSLEDLFYKYSLSSFYKYQAYDYQMPLDDNTYNDVTFLLHTDKYFSTLYNNYQSYRKNKNKRRKRVIDKVSELFVCDCLFLTLTFNNDILTRYSDKKLRELVSRFLASFKVAYVANIDYGVEFGRLHFHAILQLDHIDLKLWKYGYIFAEKIKYANGYSIGKYITKLSYHSFKDTTKDCRLIYSRKVFVPSDTNPRNFQFEYDCMCDFYNMPNYSNK